MNEYSSPCCFRQVQNQGMSTKVIAILVEGICVVLKKSIAPVKVGRILYNANCFIYLLSCVDKWSHVSYNFIIGYIVVETEL